MNTRRGFLSQLLKGTIALTAAPQIVTHGLNLKKTAGGIWVLNLEYEKAILECHFLIEESMPIFTVESTLKLIKRVPWDSSILTELKSL